MDDRRIEGVAVCTGIEDTVSGVGEEVVEGVGGIEYITLAAIQLIQNPCYDF